MVFEPVVHEWNLIEMCSSESPLKLNGKRAGVETLVVTGKARTKWALPRDAGWNGMNDTQWCAADTRAHTRREICVCVPRAVFWWLLHVFRSQGLQEKPAAWAMKQRVPGTRVDFCFCYYEFINCTKLKEFAEPDFRHFIIILMWKGPLATLPKTCLSTNPRSVEGCVTRTRYFYLLQRPL